VFTTSAVLSHDHPHTNSSDVREIATSWCNKTEKSCPLDQNIGAVDMYEYASAAAAWNGIFRHASKSARDNE
jgi:hypothetical protein